MNDTVIIGLVVVCAIGFFVYSRSQSSAASSAPSGSTSSTSTSSDPNEDDGAWDYSFTDGL